MNVFRFYLFPAVLATVGASIISVTPQFETQPSCQNYILQVNFSANHRYIHICSIIGYVLY